ncbi:MAG: hypothetical protein Q9218_003563 [Villophora microphyllina]
MSSSKRFRPLSEALANVPDLPPTQVGTPPPSPYRAPPGSPKRRRRDQERSDDIGGPMPIELFLYCSEPYRSSSARIPLPLPLTMKPMTDEFRGRVRNVPNLFQEVQNILTQHKVISTRIDLLMRSKPGYPGGDNPVPQIRVNVQATDDVDTRDCSKAKRTIFKVLEVNNLGDFEIEIIDPRRALVFSIFAIQPGTPQIQAFEKARSRLSQLLDEKLGRHWTSVCIFLVGQFFAVADYSVVVTVPPFSSADWRILRFQVIQLMDEAFSALGKPHLKGSTNAYFLTGGPQEVYHWGRAGTCQGISFAQDLDQMPGMGSSIGLPGQRGGGTLGGFFGLQIGNVVHRGVLSNHHVVCPGDDNRAGQQEADWYGVRLGRQATHPSRSTIQFPCGEDYTKSQENIRDELFLVNQSLNTLQAAIQKAGGAIPSQQRELRDLQARRTRWTTRRQQLQQFPRLLGQVLLSSGRAMTEDLIPSYIDWAFVELDPATSHVLWNHPDRNRLPDNWTMRNHEPNRYIRNAPAWDINHRPRFSNFGELKLGGWYFKLGRTTGLTAGICHGTKVLINDWPVNATRAKLFEDGTRGRREAVADDKSLEAVIINAKQIATGDRQEIFCVDGDSGALVFDQFGNCCGLMFGLWSSDESPKDRDREGYICHAGVVQPIDQVCKWIEQQSQLRDERRNLDDPPSGPPAKLVIL